MIGVSNENDFILVPTSALTVICKSYELVPAPGTFHASLRQDTFELVDHAVVAQMYPASSMTATVGVYSLAPKLKPYIVRVLPPDVGPFLLTTCDVTGASYEKAISLVPTMADTVTATGRRAPESPADVHVIML